MVGYDRYNVIVKGFSGTKITRGIAFCMILFAYAYGTAIVSVPLSEIWGKFAFGTCIVVIHSEALGFFSWGKNLVSRGDAAHMLI